MQISPVVQPQSAVWQQWHQGMLSLGVWTEKRFAHGEDAEPLLLHHWPSRCGLLAVFDGVGGAGGHAAGRTGGGSERTSAWVSSRCSRAATEEWFHRTTSESLAREPEALKASLTWWLGQLGGARRSKIVSRMRREFPTTIAALDYRMTDGGVVWNCLWAGDSRCFLLGPTEGLQQLSVDDTDSKDALELLHQDPPMTNVVSVDKPFRINSLGGDAPFPCLLLCATDGFFGYLETPAEFEHVLLNTLMQASNPAQWGSLVRQAVVSYTGDDASLSLVALGFGSFDELRERFRPRAEELVREHWWPLQQLSDREALVTAREKSWAAYRESYERRMPRTEEGRR